MENSFLFSILWCFGLINLGWPVAAFVVGFYIMCLPFTVCIEPCKAFVEFLEKGVKFPLFYAERIKEGRPCPCCKD